MEHVLTPLETFIQLLPFIIPLILLQLILMVIALVDISRREKLRWLPKWAWVLIVIFGEMIGPIVYFIFGREE
jgi:hypothetical protein